MTEQEEIQLNTLLSKHKAAIAELAVAHDLMARGFMVARPMGDFGDWDLLVERREGALYTRSYAESQRRQGVKLKSPLQLMIERVQVKYAEPVDGCIPVRNRTYSVTAGRVTKTHQYNGLIQWLAVYEPNSRQCFYVHESQLGDGAELRLRLEPTKNNQTQGVRWAKEYQLVSGELIATA